MESRSVGIWITVAAATAMLACNDGPTHPTDSTSSASLWYTNLPPFVAAVESGCLSIANIPDPPADGGAFAVDIVASCPWTVTSDQPWLTTTARPTRWNGRDSIRYTVAPNVSGQTRVGGLTVTGGGNTVRLVVTQVSGATTSQCSYSVAPTTQPATASAGNYGFDLTAGCAWEITSDQPWVNGFSQATGSGNAAITYAVAQNQTTAARTAHIEVAGPGGSVEIAVEQAASMCSYAFVPTAAQSVSSAAGSYQKSVKATCAWTATSDQTWLTTSSTGSGDGAVAFSVSANTNLLRTGHITISGAGGSAQLTVTQGGCSYQLSPPSATVPYYGGSYEFSVKPSGASCTWTAVPDQSWITIQSGGSGTGNGLVQIAIPAYASGPRVGKVTVVDQVFTVTQN